MKNVDENIQKRKDALVKKLEELKREQISENEFYFIGKCGQKHAINMKLEKEAQGILSGQFLAIGMCRDCYKDSDCGISICVGIGEGCEDGNDKGKNFLWFLEEGCNGISYTGAKSFNELKEKILIP